MAAKTVIQVSAKVCQTTTRARATARNTSRAESRVGRPTRAGGRAVRVRPVGASGLGLAAGSGPVLEAGGCAGVGRRDPAGRLRLVTGAVEVVDREAEMVESLEVRALLQPSGGRAGETQHGH